MALIMYEDEQFKLTRGDGEEMTEVSFYIKNQNEKPVRYAIPARFINESLQIPRGKLENRLDEINPEIKESLKKENISIDSAHLALCLASDYYLGAIMADRESERISLVE